MRAYMLSRFDVALYQETYVIEEIFRYYLRLFYDEYTPNSYRRTLMLLQSFQLQLMLSDDNVHEARFPS